MIAPPAAHAARPCRANRAAAPPRAARRVPPLTARRAASARPNPAPNPPRRARAAMRQPRIAQPSRMRGLKSQIGTSTAAQTAIAGQRRPAPDRPVQNQPVQNRPAQNRPPPNLLRPKSPDRAGQSHQAARARAKGGPVRGKKPGDFPLGTLAPWRGFAYSSARPPGVLAESGVFFHCGAASMMWRSIDFKGLFRCRQPRTDPCFSIFFWPLSPMWPLAGACDGPAFRRKVQPHPARQSNQGPARASANRLARSAPLGDHGTGSPCLPDPRLLG